VVSARTHPARDDAAHDLTVLELAADPHAEMPFRSWVVDEMVAIMSRLREILSAATADDPVHVAVLHTTSSQPDPWHAAAAEGLCEALRGLVGALTLELGPALRINLVLVSADSSREVTADTLAFLGSPSGGFASGSTFDLRATW
jgi:hypothetical protein